MFLSAKVTNIIQINITYTRHFLGKKKLFFINLAHTSPHFLTFFFFLYKAFLIFTQKKLNLNPHEK